LSRTVLSFADCFFVFSFAISPFRLERDDRGCFWVVGAVFFLGLMIGPSFDPFETTASVVSIVFETSTTVLSETHVVAGVA
jgi:hypothetical protein